MDPQTEENCQEVVQRGRRIKPEQTWPNWPQHAGATQCQGKASTPQSNPKPT